jgi:hypothetical protein
MLRHLKFYENHAVRSIAKYVAGPSDLPRLLSTLCDDLERLRMSAYALDLSSRFSWADSVSSCVVKAVIPFLQPLFVDDSFRLLSKDRLRRLGRTDDTLMHFFSD